jgi:hypothetical protein
MVMSLRRGARHGPALRRAAVALVSVAAGLVLLAACGTTPAPGSGGAAPAAGASGSPGAASTAPGSAQPALCQDAAAVTSLRIVRLPGPRVPQAQTALPGQVTAVSPAQARVVARALCALPAMPNGILNCPALFAGTTYQLRFTADGRALPAVTLEATGCDTVTGVGHARRALSPGFWRVLATAAGLSPPGQAVFGMPGCQSVKIDGCPGLTRPAGIQPGGVQPGAPDVPAG